MNFYEQSLVELYERLARQVSYYREDNLVAVDMAVQIRALIHNASSLLSQLKKENVVFFSSSDKNWKKPGISHRNIGNDISNITYIVTGPLPSSLVGASHVKSGANLKNEFIPLFFEGNKTYSTLSLNEWWNEEVAFINNPAIYFKRMDIILGVANKDGGAHYVKKTDTPFRKLKSEKLLMVEVNGVPISTENFPLYAIICQIAHEVLKSIEHLKNDYLQSK